MDISAKYGKDYRIAIDGEYFESDIEYKTLMEMFVESDAYIFEENYNNEDEEIEGLPLISGSALTTDLISGSALKRAREAYAEIDSDRLMWEEIYEQYGFRACSVSHL